MNKQAALEALIEELRRECASAIRASKDAADYATNEESRAESKWDTQGLEASYLAAGQAAQARQYADAIEGLISRRGEILKPCRIACGGALVEVEIQGKREAFFILPVAGGIEIIVDQVPATVVSIRSPLAQAILGKCANDPFRTPNGSQGTICSVE